MVSLQQRRSRRLMMRSQWLRYLQKCVLPKNNAVNKKEWKDLWLNQHVQNYFNMWLNKYMIKRNVRTALHSINEWTRLSKKESNKQSDTLFFSYVMFCFECQVGEIKDDSVPTFSSHTLPPTTKWANLIHLIVSLKLVGIGRMIMASGTSISSWIPTWLKSHHKQVEIKLRFLTGCMKFL